MTNNQHLPLAHELAPSGSHVLNIDQLPADLSAENPCFSIDPDGLACLIYTSGSTGQPKGVMHTHRTVLHMTMVATNALRICAEDRLVLLYSPSFLAATRVIFLAVFNGAALFPFNIKEEGLTHFGTWLTQKGITFYYSIPTVFRHFIRTLRDEAAFPSVRLIWLSGESVDQRDVALYRKHFSSDCLFIHVLWWRRRHQGPSSSILSIRRCGSLRIKCRSDMSLKVQRCCCLTRTAKKSAITAWGKSP